MIKFSASQAYLGQSFKDLLEIPEYASNWYRLLLGEETEQDWLGGFVQDTEHGNGWAMRDEISDVSLHDAAGKTLYWQPHGEDWEHAQVDSAHQTASDVFTDPPEWLQIWTGKLDDQNNVVDGGVVDTSEINPHGQGWIESQDLEDLTVTQEQEDHNHVYARTAGGEWQHVQMEFSDAPKLDLYLEQDVVPDDVDTSDGYTLGGFGIPDADPEDSFDYQVTGGADQDVFTIQNGGLVFEAGTEIDYHAQSEYEVEVTGQDQDGNESIETFTVYVTYADGAGNSRAEAREIGVLSQGDTFEHSEDVGRLGDHADYYSFELEDNLDVAVEASGQDETRNAMGLRLYDSQGSLISHSNQDNDQESIAVTLEEGVYYVNVYEYLGRSEDYDLSIRADTFRTADSPEKAMEIGELSPGDSREHSVEVFDRIVREDYYTFTLTEQGQVDISMLFDEDLDQNLGFRILDSDEEHIEFDVSDTGEAFLSQELEAGDYYIEAWPVHGSHEYELNVDVNEPGGTLEDFSSEAGDTELNKTAADKATASNQKKEYFQEESDSLGTEQMDYDFSQSYTENSSLSTENDSSNILNFSDDSIGMWAGEEGVSLDKTFDDFLLDETIEGSPIFETASHELSYNYHTSIKAGLLAELNLETGHLDLDYPVDMDPGVPETVSSGQSFSVDTSDYSLTEATLQSNAPNPNDFGFSVDLIPPQLEMSVSDISLDAPLWSPASSFEYSGFDVDIAPAGDPISLVDGTLGDFELDQDFGPVGFEMGMPTGLELESQPVSSHTLDPVSTQGDDYGTTDDSFVNLGLSLTGLAQNAFGFPDLLESSYDFGVAELGYTVADVSANLGLTFAQDFTFEPGEVEVSMQTQDGQVQTGQLGDDFTFDAPEDSGSMDIDATYTLNGEINNNTGVMPNGSITADVLDAHLEILDFVDIGMDPLYSDEFPDGGWDALDEPLWLYENTFDLELEEDVTYQTEIGDDLPAHLSIDSFGDVSVQESQTVTVAAAVENTGDRETTQNISLSVDDVHLEEEFTIPAGDTRDISFDLDTAEHGLDIGEYDLELDTGDESESVTLEVLPADDESDDDFLEIYDISISPESPGVGESFSVKVKGFGAQSADAVNPSVTLAIPKDDYEHTFNPASLDDGQTEEVIFLEGIVDAGEYKAEVTVDAVNAQSVTEQIEFAIGGSDQDVHYVVTDYEELDFALQDKDNLAGDELVIEVADDIDDFDGSQLLYEEDADLVIRGQNAESYTLNAGGDSRILETNIHNGNGSLIVENLDFKGGDGGNAGGGALLVKNNLEISGSEFSNNQSGTFGGAIYAMNPDGEATITDSSFDSNHSGIGGGISSGGYLKVESSTFEGNSADNFGGGLETQQGAQIDESSFSDNYALNGAAVYGIYNGKIQISDCSIVNNDSPYHYGVVSSSEVDIYTRDSDYIDNSDPVFDLHEAEFIDEGGNTFQGNESFNPYLNELEFYETTGSNNVRDHVYDADDLGMTFSYQEKLPREGDLDLDAFAIQITDADGNMEKIGIDSADVDGANLTLNFADELSLEWDGEQYTMSSEDWELTAESLDDFEVAVDYEDGNISDHEDFNKKVDLQGIAHDFEELCMA